MAEAKTKKTRASVSEFLAKAATGERLADARKLVRIMSAITGDRPAMWGPSIVGFGAYTLTYASGRTAEWPVAAFAPRKPATVVYITRGAKNYEALIKKIGKVKIAGGCMHIKSLADVNVDALTQLIAECAEYTREKHRKR
ncbi:MAG: DUF1801 domain-containing protein [Gemmatimonadota bacterium]|nr:DUF1801 domain-containing protein [Gemmatimonadota bacterium]